MEEDKEIEVDIEDGKTKRALPEARYRPKYHPGRVYELWGENMMHHRKICTMLRITEFTLKKWLTKHRKFAIQYELGMMKGQTKWIDYGVENLGNRNFQGKAYEMIIKLAFNEFSDNKKVMIAEMRKAASLTDKMKAIDSLFYCGQYSADEIRALAAAIADSSSSMGETAKLKERVDVLSEEIKIQTGNRNVQMEGDIYEAELIPLIEKKDDPSQTD